MQSTPQPSAPASASDALPVDGLSLTSQAGLPPLIPREVLFGNPERMNPQLSPDGKRIAWVAPDDKNVLQVWLQTIGQDDVRCLTDDQKRGIRDYFWCEDDQTLIYLKDADGDENWRLFGVNILTNQVRELTPFAGVQASVLDVRPEFPDTVLVALNLRNPELHDVYRLSISTGELVLDTENPGRAMHFVADHQLNVRLLYQMSLEGGVELHVRETMSSPWRLWLKCGPEETLSPHGFTADGKGIYLSTSLNSDTARLVERNLETDEETLLAASTEVDVGSVLIDPLRHGVQAAAFSPGRTHWQVIDPAIQSDLDGIRALQEGDFGIVNRDRSDTHWLVAFTSDRGPIYYYAWDRSARQGRFLFVHQTKLLGLTLGEMKSIRFTARDGLMVHGYLTLPPGLQPEQLPLVLMVHGGPWVRDVWGYNAQAQWFANRGYACLQVNYRASTGYGKKFLGAGYKQWGKAMHDDLIDGVRWTVQEGVVDPSRVAIFGGSYGGYATLAGMTFTPEFFACGVAVVGPSNLLTFINSIPPYWRAFRTLLDVRVGNIDDPAEQEMLKEVSPLFHVQRIARPLLISQGANDPRVVAQESHQMVDEIQRKGGSVTYVLYPDEGHGFVRPENRLDFNVRMEKFLAEHLGGRFEDFPDHLSRVPGSTALIQRIVNGVVEEDSIAQGATLNLA